MTAKTDEPTGVNWNGATTNEYERVEVEKIRTIHVHDSPDSTHGAVRHGCYPCGSERVTAYSGRHMTDFRHIMTNPQKIPPPARTIPCNEPIRQGGPHGDGQRHRTYGKVDEGRRGEAVLGTRHKHHPGDQHVFQAGSEGAEDPPSRSPTGRPWTIEPRAWKSRTCLPNRPPRPRSPFTPKRLRLCKQDSCAIIRS